ncbi:hypothetical protein EG329_006769 [Mollisiaceae sp. DMI_Dod_QoI]|nr:hypothetical protein EG329_006769 [Helotiales sp. DMI_Dod_QoI]
MGKIREKLGEWSSKYGRATMRPGTLSDVPESTNASPSSLTEQHHPPELPAQVGSTNAAPQLATTPTSPAHAAKTHVPPPVPPLADPPAEPDPEVEERQPVMKLTKRQTPASDEETPQDSPELLLSRLSCWGEAAKNLRLTKPDVYKKLEEIKSKYKDYRQSDPADLLNAAESRWKDKGVPTVVEQTIRSILQFKEIVAGVANFDPHKIAPVVWRAFCVVLEACLNDPTFLRGAPKDLNTIISNLCYWANVEPLYLGTGESNILNKFAPLKPDLIKLYTAILELEMKIEQHDKVKTWISNYQPKKFHDEALERTGVGQKYPTCGQWLLNSPKFTDWSLMEPASEHRILWLRGTTGTGKSTLVLQNSNHPMASGQNFFVPRSPICILLLLRRDKSERVLIQVGASGTPPTSSIQSCGLELLVSSRNQVQVDKKFPKEEFPKLVIVDLNESVSDTDMVTYINSEVRVEDYDERILEGKYPDLEDRLIEILCRRAGRMFRWVQLQLSFFLEPGGQATIRNAKTVKQFLDKLDTGSVAGENDMKLAYDAIFTRNTRRDTHERRHVIKIYKILLGCMQPISIATITRAVAFNENTCEVEIEINETYKLLSADPAYNLNLNPDDRGLTPLSLAVYKGHKAIVKLLLEKGADANAAGQDGSTPLHQASENGHVEVVKLLLEKGADANTAGRDRSRPLHRASRNGHIEVVKLLSGSG